MSTKQDRTVVKIDSDIKAAAIKRASDDRRTLSAVINLALLSYIGQDAVDELKNESEEM